MLANNQNVVELNNNNVYKDIMTYLQSLEKRTRISYETDIKQFFKYITKGKEIEHLTEEDLKLKRNHILSFRNYLKELGLSNGTINHKITSIKGLFEEFQANEYDVNAYIFKIKRLKYNPESYEEISLEFAESMSQAVFITEKTKALTKHLLIKFATRTSFRIDEILRVKWSDFTEYKGVYKIDTIAKGQKEHTTAISSKLYHELLELKDENQKYKWNRSQDIVFQLSSDAVNDMMKRLRKHFNIEDRKIVFHSFRSVGINLEFETTNDIKKVIEHSGHSNMDTAYKHYLSKKRDFTNTPGVKIDEELNWSFLNNLTTEDFKEFFIKNNYKFYNDIRNFHGEQKDQK